MLLGGERGSAGTRETESIILFRYDGPGANAPRLPSRELSPGPGLTGGSGRAGGADGGAVPAGGPDVHPVVAAHAPDVDALVQVDAPPLVGAGLGPVADPADGGGRAGGCGAGAGRGEGEGEGQQDRGGEGGGALAPVDAGHPRMKMPVPACAAMAVMTPAAVRAAARARVMSARFTGFPSINGVRLSRYGS